MSIDQLAAVHAYDVLALTWAAWLAGEAMEWIGGQQ